jgi:hypothetical protein
MLFTAVRTDLPGDLRPAQPAKKTFWEQAK